jgi:hypothetical protein
VIARKTRTVSDRVLGYRDEIITEFVDRLTTPFTPLSASVEYELVYWFTSNPRIRTVTVPGLF